MAVHVRYKYISLPSSADSSAEHQGEIIKLYMSGERKSARTANFSNFYFKQ